LQGCFLSINRAGSLPPLLPAADTRSIVFKSNELTRLLPDNLGEADEKGEAQ
jgi:hypothetical protein